MDPSIGTFHYTETEREEFRLKGLTDEEIDQKEIEASQKIAEAKVAQEMKDSGVEIS